jgi:uncharacterized protein YqjF (DUF2071 family)
MDRKNMADIHDILGTVSHRKFKYPDGKWHYYQEWNRVLFFHWAAPAEVLRKAVPKGLELDLFEGKAWISLVPFTMENIRPRQLPPFAPISDFHEVNLRTYVIHNNIPGVYFISIEAQKWLSAKLSKGISGLPYEKSVIRRSHGKYVAANALKKFSLDVEYAIGEAVGKKSGLESFLTERYALYLGQNGKLFRYDTHHREWKIKSVDIKKLHLDYKIPGLDLAGKQPEIVHYSDGVEVIAWQKIAL